MNRLPIVVLGMLCVIMLVVLAAPILAAETAGKIKSVDADKGQFVLTDTNNKNWTFHLDRDGKVFINDKEGKLADLRFDDMASVTYERQNEKLVASVVRCQRK